MSVHQTDNGKRPQHDGRLKHAVEPTVQSVLLAAEQVGTRIRQHAEANPATATPAAILELQRTFGNRAVQRLVRAGRAAAPTALVQRDKDPKVGWSDAATKGAKTNQTSVTAPSGGWNEGETVSFPVK